MQRGHIPKPAVPKRDEKPIHGLVSDKNFIVANAVENILAGKFFFLVGHFSQTSLKAPPAPFLGLISWIIAGIDGPLVAVTIFRDGEVWI